MRESGREFTETYVAVPGHSEHETGLAIDLGLKQDVIDFIRPEFHMRVSASDSGSLHQNTDLLSAIQRGKKR